MRQPIDRTAPGSPARRAALTQHHDGPTPRLAEASDADAASLHAQISALKVMRRRMKAFRRRKRQRAEEPEDDVSMITAETIKETSESHRYIPRLASKIGCRRDSSRCAMTHAMRESAGPRAPASLQRLHFATDHATGEPIRRLIMGPWRRDASQLRRVVACCDHLEFLDLAPCLPRYGAPWRRCGPLHLLLLADGNGPDDHALSVLAMAAASERIDGLRPLRLKALGLSEVRQRVLRRRRDMSSGSCHVHWSASTSRTVYWSEASRGASADPITPSILKEVILDRHARRTTGPV